MSNRLAPGEDLFSDKETIDESIKFPIYKNSPTSNLNFDKPKFKLFGERKTKRNIS